MTMRFGAWMLAFLLVVEAAMAQTDSWRGSSSGPDQPVRREVPSFKEHTPATRQQQQPATPAPFRLSPQHEAYLDRVLMAWEQRSARVKTFECDFTQWTYDSVFSQNQGGANTPKHTDLGHIKYAAPDKGRFEVKGDRPEKWICNGKAVFEYNHDKRQLIEYKLPPEMQGKAIANSPLPFIFGAKAAELKRRYFMRITTPTNVQGQIWLEVYPKLREDAANFQRAELILTVQGMTPQAMQIYELNGKDRKAYQFYNIVVNDPLRFFKGNPFDAMTPPFWKKVVEEPQTAQAARPAEQDRR